MWDLVFRIVSAAVKDDGVEGAVELAVAAAAEPVAGGLFRSRPGSGRRQSLRGWESLTGSRTDRSAGVGEQAGLR
jgi:hypothetical protein